MKICVLNSTNEVKIFAEEMSYVADKLFYKGYVVAQDLTPSNSTIYEVTDYPDDMSGGVYNYTSGGGFELI